MIERLTVVEPPTSGELSTAYIASLELGRPLELVVLPIQDIPLPVERRVVLDVINTQRHLGKFTLMSGKTLDSGSSLIVNLHDDNEPATAHLIKP